MSKASDFLGGSSFGAPTSLIRGSTFDPAVPAGNFLVGTLATNSPILVANVAQNVVNVTGKGFLNFAAFRVAVQVSNPARIFTVRVIIDGTTILTSDLTNTQLVGQGHILVGDYYRQFDGARTPLLLQPIPFKTSFQISVACAIAETANFSATFVNYELYA